MLLSSEAQKDTVEWITEYKANTRKLHTLLGFSDNQETFEPATGSDEALTRNNNHELIPERS
jgi:hypothetical protein